MDIAIAKGLLGLACFLQTQGPAVVDSVKSNLSDSELEIVKVIEASEEPCLLIPDDLKVFLEEEVLEDSEVLLASGEPTMSFKQ